jgi:hypothetical protein
MTYEIGALVLLALGTGLRCRVVNDLRQLDLVPATSMLDCLRLYAAVHCC